MMLQIFQRLNKRIVILIFCVSFCYHFPVYFPASAFGQQTSTLAEQEDLEFIRNLFRDKQYDYAEQETHAYLKKYPKGKHQAEIIFIQAQISVIKEAYDSALNRYHVIIDKHTQSPFLEDALYFSGILRIQLNQENGAPYLHRLLKQFPNTKYLARISFYLGQLAFKKNTWTEAENHFKDVLKSVEISEEQHLQAQNFLAWTYFFQGKQLLAKSLFLELLESKISVDYKARIGFQLAVDWQKEKKYRRAITWYKRQMNDWPHPDFQDKSRFWIAECYFLIYRQNSEELKSNEIDEAVDFYSKNIMLKQPVAPLVSRHHRGQFYILQNQPQKAEADFAWLQDNSEPYAADIDLTMTRASIFEKKGDFSNANKVYIKSMQYEMDSTSKNLVLHRIIRNDYDRKDCKSVLTWKKEADYSVSSNEVSQIRYYSGKCNIAAKQWESAKKDFSGLPLDSPYAKLVFWDHLTTFEKTKDFKGGMNLLKQAGNYPDLVDKNELATRTIDFCTTLKQWPAALTAMQEMIKLDPKKKNDPWFLLKMAKTSDRAGTENKLAKQKKYYNEKSLQYYHSALKQLPSNNVGAKLSVLDILVDRNKRKGNYKEVADYYKQAIVLIKSEKRKDELNFQIAKIYIKRLKKIEAAKKILNRLHKKKGKTDVQFEASTMLAEVYVDQKKYTQATQILTELSKKPIAGTKWYVTVHFRLGELYQSMEKWKKSLKHYTLVANSKKKSQLKQKARKRMFDIKKYLMQTSEQKKS